MHKKVFYLSFLCLILFSNLTYSSQSSSQVTESQSNSIERIIKFLNTKIQVSPGFRKLIKEKKHETILKNLQSLAIHYRHGMNALNEEKADPNSNKEAVEAQIKLLTSKSKELKHLIDNQDLLPQAVEKLSTRMTMKKYSPEEIKQVKTIQYVLKAINSVYPMSKIKSRALARLPRNFLRCIMQGRGIVPKNKHEEFAKIFEQALAIVQCEENDYHPRNTSELAELIKAYKVGKMNIAKETNLMVTIAAKLIGMNPLQVPAFDEEYRKGNHKNDLHWLGSFVEEASKRLLHLIKKEKIPFEMTQEVDTRSTSITAERLFLRALCRLDQERVFPAIKDSVLSKAAVARKKEIRREESVIEQYKKGNLQSEDQAILNQWFKKREEKLKKEKKDLRQNAKRARLTMKSAIKETEARDFLACSVCLDNVADHMLQRFIGYDNGGKKRYESICQHITTCQSCANKLTKAKNFKCPSCRALGDCYRQVYLPSMDDSSVQSFLRRSYKRKRETTEKTSSHTINASLIKAINGSYASSIFAESLGAYDQTVFIGSPVRNFESEALTTEYNRQNAKPLRRGWLIYSTSGHGLNCLIDAIAQSLGLQTSPQERERIRSQWLEEYPGLQYLPNDQNVLYRILLALGVEEPHTVGITFYSEGGEIDNKTWNPSSKTRTIYVYHSGGHYESLKPY